MTSRTSRTKNNRRRLTESQFGAGQIYNNRQVRAMCLDPGTKKNGPGEWFLALLSRCFCFHSDRTCSIGKD
jgi:hypothetical protein